MLATTADICNIDKNSMDIYSQKNQTQMKFLSREPVQFHMQNDYVFPEVNFRTCHYTGVSFECKAEKIMDTLHKKEVYSLLCNTRSYLLVSCVKWTHYLLLKIALWYWWKCLMNLTDKQNRQCSAAIKLYWLPAQGKILAERDPVKWCPVLLGLIWSSWGLHYDKNIEYKSMSKTFLFLHDCATIVLAAKYSNTILFLIVSDNCTRMACKLPKHSYF